MTAPAASTAPRRPSERVALAAAAALLLCGAAAFVCGWWADELVPPATVGDVFTPAELAAAPFRRAGARLGAHPHRDPAGRSLWTGSTMALSAGLWAWMTLYGRWRRARSFAAAACAVGLLRGLWWCGLAVVGDAAFSHAGASTLLSPAEWRNPAARSAARAMLSELAAARPDERLLWATGLTAAAAGAVGLIAALRDRPVDLFADDGPGP